MAVKRWWHRWQGVCPDGVLTALMPGISPDGPDEIDTTRVVSIPTIGCPAESCETVMGYVGSWDHDPTDVELDAVTPPGYRSTDQEESEPVIVGSLHQVLDEGWVPPPRPAGEARDG